MMKTENKKLKMIPIKNISEIIKYINPINIIGIFEIEYDFPILPILYHSYSYFKYNDTILYIMYSKDYYSIINDRVSKKLRYRELASGIGYKYSNSIFNEGISGKYIKVIGNVLLNDNNEVIGYFSNNVKYSNSSDLYFVISKKFYKSYYKNITKMSIINNIIIVNKIPLKLYNYNFVRKQLNDGLDLQDIKSKLNEFITNTFIPTIIKYYEDKE